MAGNPPQESSRELARRGWSWKLAAVSSALLVVAGATGLWLYLGPFSLASQLLLIGHVVLGLVLLVAFPLYLWRHVATWWRQTVTATMILGYILSAGALVAIVSGVVLTWQAVFATHLSRTWDLVHLIGGISVFALTMVHLFSAVLRRRRSLARDPELAAAMRRFRGRFVAYAGVPAVVIAACWLAWPKTQYLRAVPEDYGLPSYAQQFDEYRGNPFAPTYARTETLELVSPELLANSASCGTSNCHEQILAEWEPSAHRFSAMNPPFQEVQRRFAEEREPAETRYCAGCHDPISLFAGAKDLHAQSLSAPGVDEGLSCVVCHAISLVDERGNADYVLTPPRKYIGENGTGFSKFVSDFLIRAYPRQHLADYDRNLLRTPEYCGACHKQFIPEALNRFGFVEGQNQYDEWKNGHWHSDDPEVDLSCTDCHMRLVAGSTDPGRGEEGEVHRTGEDEAHRHHGFIATNNFMPAVLKLPHWEEQVRLTDEWMRGETVVPEIANRWPEGPVASLRLVAPREALPGDQIEVRALVTNRKAGHNFITGPLDFVRSWIHMKVEDSDGRVIAEWGSINPATRRIEDMAGVEHQIANKRDEGTLVLEAIPIGEDGAELRKHELWRKAGGKGKRVIFPTYVDSHLFRFELPPDVAGPVSISADLNYRRYRQEFLDLVLPNLEESTGTYQPIVTQAEAAHVIEVAVPAVAAAG